MLYWENHEADIQAMIDADNRKRSRQLKKTKGKGKNEKGGST